MSLRFCVLGSGSSGNASYLEADGFGVLLDVGLGPRRLARGLADAGATWDRVRAVILTHTHGDHWHRKTFGHLLKRRIGLFCHYRHAESLSFCEAFADLVDAGLVTTFEMNQPLAVGPMRGLPFAVPHDDNPTCGFRVEGGDASGATWALGYAADLGSWSEKIVRQLCDVDILALEFNHDVDMERASRRAPMLIDRVLGDHGHLSNDQGAAPVREVLRRSGPERTQHLMLLHLSRQCNHPRLARAAAGAAVAQQQKKIHVHAASHNLAGPVLTAKAVTRIRRIDPPVPALRQGYLPGWQDEATLSECLQPLP